MRRILLVLLLVLSATPVPGAVPLEESWARVRSAIHGGRPDAVVAEIASLRRLGASLDVERMPAYAEALVRWAEQRPGDEGLQALHLATRLDRRCADARFAIAARRWENADVLGASVAYAAAWRDLVLRPESRRDLMTSLLLCGILGLTAALLVAMAVQTARFIPQLLHDGRELGQQLFGRPNAVVFAGVLCVLPLFGGLDPVWLLGYGVALSWVYFPLGERFVVGLAWLLVVLAVPGLELWEMSVLQKESPITTAGKTMQRRVARPMVVDRLMALEPEMEDNAAFHELAGGLLHMHGESEPARDQFRKAHRLERERVTAHLWLGCIGVEEGNIGLAIQEYRRAVALAPGYAPAYHNLSVALDRAHLFQEADEARRAAEQHPEAGPPVRYRRVDGDRVAFPANARALVSEIVEGLPIEKRRVLGLRGPTGRPLEWLVQPLTLAFLASGLLGVVLFWARMKWMWAAQSCARCGQVFCERCKTSTMSGTYCSQCISVFLKQETVAVEQRSAKLAQIRRRNAVRAAVRRILAAVAPGAGCIAGGRVLLGTVLLCAASVLILAMLVWLPRFVTTLAFTVPVLPVQIALAVVFVIIWLVSIRLAWGES